MKIITINQLNDLLKGFAANHLFLNDYGIGQTSEIGTSRKLKFPYMWTSLGENTNIEIANKTAIPVIDLTLLFVDQTNIQSTGDNFNVLENLSDCFQIVQDIITVIESEWGKYGIKITDTPRAFPVIDETTDSVNGWGLDLRLKLVHSNCQIPTKL